MRRGVFRGVCAALLALSLAAYSAAAAEAGTGAPAAGAAHLPGQLVVRYAADASPAERRAALAERRARVAAALRLPRTALVQLPAGASVGAAAASLEADPAVEFAEPNYVYTLASLPNDPLFPHLWGLHQATDGDIDAPEAWALTTGSANVVVGVIDTGVAYAHPDLAPNAWTNEREIAGNGVDDDRNGRIDDTHGWDFVEGDNTPLDAHGHGTHVAGTIGARGNDGFGVVGVNWRVRLMSLRAGDAEGAFTSRAIADAIVYACANGARVVNGSFGGSAISSAVTTAMNSSACARTLFVYSAGNEGANNDVTSSFPCNAAVASLVCVAATDSSDSPASYSNYGPQNVDLAAPGSSILSTWLNGHRSASGTSMAAPHVAGAAALVLGRNDSLSPIEVRATLLMTVDRLPGVATRVASGGRLNAASAVAAVPALVAPAAGEPAAAPGAGPTPSALQPAPRPSATTPAPAPVVRCVVPKLRGRTLAAAKTALRTRNCNLGKVTRASSSVVRKGRVLRQSRPAGTGLAAGARIGVVVSLGRRP
jgi:subtilisin family serine protease